MSGEGEVFSFSTVWLKMARGEAGVEEEDDEVEVELVADVIDSLKATSRGCNTSFRAISA